MKRILLILLAFTSYYATAGELADKKKKAVASQNTMQIGKDSRKGSFMGPMATITLANGSKKNLENIAIGDQLTTCKKGHQVTTIVTGVTVFNNPTASLMAVYLRPDNAELTMVPAILLEAAGHHKVQTSHGRKKLRNLNSKDILYRYDSDTGIVSAWKVGAIKRNAKKVSRAYQITTEAGTFLADNLLVSNQ